MNVQQLHDGKWQLAGLFIPLGGVGRDAHIVHVFPSLNFALETGGLAIMDALDNGPI